MDRRLLEYYTIELSHLRQMGAEFAREFPKIASGLGVDVTPCPDPYVERLLDGYAFMAARVHLKLESEFPRFTQALLESVYPHYLAPTPSMAVVQMQPDLNEASLAEGAIVPRNSVLRSPPIGGAGTSCEFRTAHDVTLWPLRVVEAEYHTQNIGALGLPENLRPRAALRVRIETTAGLPMSALAMSELVLYLSPSADPRARSKIYEQLFAKGAELVVQEPMNPAARRSARRQEVITDWRRAIGFGDHEALLPFDARSFHGYRLLKEYFTLPDRFLFVGVRGLAPAVRRCPGNQLDLLFLLTASDLDLEGAVDKSQFELFCTPAINLFPREADRIHLSERHAEFQVTPDRTRPLDFEVYQVRSVTGFGASAQEAREFGPFYAARDIDAESNGHAYFSVNRVPRTLSERERRFGRRSVSYPGSEVYVSLVDAKAAPYRPDLRQLAVTTLCTNRDLALHLPPSRGPLTDFTWEVGAPLETVRCVTGPTPPRPSWAEGDASWRLISHLCLNYLSLSDSDERAGAQALRELLRLYADQSEPSMRRQVDQGVRSVTTAPITRRVPGPGPITFARGLEVSLVMDELAFEGSGVFLLAAVLERFFARYVSINSFTETVLKTPERGEVVRWPARMGRQNVL